MANSLKEVSLLSKIAVKFASAGQGFALLLTNRDGSTFETGLTGEQLNHFVAMILNVLRELGARAQPEDLASRPFVFTPVSVANLVLTDSNIPGDTIMSVQLGAATISFSVPTAKLHEMCRKLGHVPAPIPPRSLN